MLNLSLTQIFPNKQSRYLFILVISSLLIAFFITSCGGGDTDEEASSPTSIVQPTSTPSTETTLPPVAVAEAAPEVGVSFQNDILPILEKNCVFAGCHAAGGAANLDLTGYNAFKRGGNGGPSFVAGNAKKSLVIIRIDGGGMPPAGPLDNDLVDLVKDWINEGAENN